MNKIKLTKYIKPVFHTPEDISCWFGYYNYDALNYDQTKLLCGKTNNDSVIIEKGMTIEIGYFDIPSGKWHHIGDTDSYNWPQGAMAQWIPGKGNENKVIFNLSKNNHNIARIHDIISGQDQDIDWSIYGLTPDGMKSISLNMERQHWCRGYHYESVSNTKYDVNISDDDGIFEIDLNRNIRKRIIAIHDIIAIDKEKYFDKAKHWLEHIMVSRDGKYFCFLHRCTTSTLNDYETRLFIANIDGTNLQIVEGWRNNYWSHFGWNGNNDFVIYSYKGDYAHQKANNSMYEEDTDSKQKSRYHKNNLTKRLIKKIWTCLPQYYRQEINIITKRQITCYQYYTIKNGKIQLSSEWASHNFCIDGHPSFTQDNCYMITDTYPDQNQYQHLIIYNLGSKKSIIIAKLFAQLHNKPGSCDLHPKLCSNNKYLAVDTAYDGKHHMIIFELDWNKIKEKIKK